MATPTFTRRTVLNTAALATTGLVMPFVHGASAAGKLSCGFWDHWVPGANEPLAKLCREWADREKVDLTIDFITSQGVHRGREMAHIFARLLDPLALPLGNPAIDMLVRHRCDGLAALRLMRMLLTRPWAVLH